MTTNSREKNRNHIATQPKHNLRLRIIEARARWEISIRENRIVEKTASGKSGRSRRKVLYVVADGEWLTEFKAELRSLQTQLAKAENIAIRNRRKMWLPTVIEFAEVIQPVIYQASSPRKCNTTQARAFLQKSGSALRLPSPSGQEHKISYVVRYSTGRNYKLRITAISGEKIDLPFTDWAVCICDGPSSIPRLRKAHIRYQPVSGALCTREKSALFVNERDDAAYAKKLKLKIRVMNVVKKGGSRR